MLPKPSRILEAMTLGIWFEKITIANVSFNMVPDIIYMFNRLEKCRIYAAK